MAKTAKKVANDNKASKSKKKPALKLVKTPKKSKASVKPAVKSVKLVKATPQKTAQKSVAKAAPKSLYEFAVGDNLVYPTHGVGKVTAIETTEVAGTKVTLYVLYFEKEKMTLRVPVTRAAAVGLRRLSSGEQLKKALTVLKSKARTARGMWSRRATEYGQKINSGNIEYIAQVVRDLHKNVDDPDRSYSERVIYESAFGRLAGEFAAINKIDAKKAEELLVDTLKKKAA